MENYLNMLPLVAIIFVFYFMIFRPNQQKAKQQKEFASNLAKGDVVVTNSGIVGKVNKVDDENGLVNIQVDGKTYLKVLKDAVSKELSEGMANSSIEL